MPLSLADYVTEPQRPPSSVAGLALAVREGTPVAINPRDLVLVQHAIAVFGGITARLELPASAKAQTGRRWTETIGPAGVRDSWQTATVAVSGYARSGPECVFDGATQPMTWGFWRSYCAEAWVPLTSARLAAAPAVGLNTVALLADLHLSESDHPRGT